MIHKDFERFELIDEDVEFMPVVSLTENKEGGDQLDHKEPVEIPILPLKNTVLFPGVVIPIAVGRSKSLKAIRKAHKTNKLIGVLAQKDVHVEDPEGEDLNEIGCLARIIKIIKMPEGNPTVIIQGKSRIKTQVFSQFEPYIGATCEILPDVVPKPSKEFKALIDALKEQAEKVVRLSPQIPSEAGIVVSNIDSPKFLISFIASNLNIEVTKKQELLEIEDFEERSQKILMYLNEETQMLELKNKIQNKVKGEIEKQQRDYFLHQQMKTIQEELGAETPYKEISDLETRSRKMKWGKDIQEQFQKEIAKLRRMNPAVAEYSVTMNYLELLLELPWGKVSKDNFNLKQAKRILDKDHFGLDDVKERVLEYLAVLKLKGDMKSPILCLVGPPGVGKTSLGRSIAEALNRQYVRISLGGLHDESEIRGHRKTYIGAMPGRIIQSLKKAKTSNPVFILDEVDKIGKDFRGDPSSALLEVLDPEQNSTFYDNYLELEFDLSKVMFIATANSLSTIQPALLDRMEIIQMSGYSLEEKTEIAKRHLLPKLLENHGLSKKDMSINKKSLEYLISNYTRESGVRGLERVIAKLMRNVAKSVAFEESFDNDIDIEDIQNRLGYPKFAKDKYQKDLPYGVAVGLAWTQVGGDILFIETAKSSGKGNLKLTGNLGNVMKESASTALSYLKSNGSHLGIEESVFEQYDFHLHVPEGAIPKDGPSAGVTILVALSSLILEKKIKPYHALTGEITLRGKILPVGGVKEKILAAKRAGIKNIVLCSKNKNDIDQIDERYIKGLTFNYFDEMKDMLDYLLM